MNWYRSYKTAAQHCPCGGKFEYLMDDKLRAKMWLARHPGQGIPQYDVQVCMECGRYLNESKQSNPTQWSEQKAEEVAAAQKARKRTRLPNENKEHWEAKERLGPDTRTDSSGAVTTPGDR